VIELYQFEECPYCSKVRKKLCDLGIDFVARVVPKDRTLRDKVEELSGQRSVPVLVDSENGKVVSDSEQIVEYLDNLFYI
jgi:glutathione S-transferase